MHEKAAGAQGSEIEPSEAAASPKPVAPVRVFDGNVVLIWQSIASRRIAYDTMMWQTPALGLTAQAFLLTLALGGQMSSLGRAVAAVLAAALAVTTMQLMAKHRLNELRDSRLLETIEEAHGFAEAVGVDLHAFRRRSLLPNGGRFRILASRLRRYSSFRLWIAGQLAFLLVAVLVLVLVATGSSGVLDAR